VEFLFGNNYRFVKLRYTKYLQPLQTMLKSRLGLDELKISGSYGHYFSVKCHVSFPFFPDFTDQVYAWIEGFSPGRHPDPSTSAPSFQHS
jgi:hypothetical protein